MSSMIQRSGSGSPKPLLVRSDSPVRGVLAGGVRLTTVAALAWVLALAAAVVAMWALAPSIMALQSLEPMATPPGLGLGGLPPRQASAAAVAAAEDLQKQPAQTQQVPPGTTQTASPAATVDASHVTTHTLLQQVLQRLDQQQQQQPQQQQQQQLQPELDPLHSLPADLVQQLGPVDVVYLWVNGSDPVLTQELRQLAASRAAHSSKTQHPTVLADNPLRQARFDSGRDELSYSLRSLEMHMPWFRNVYIVTNGQVPSWLDVHNPRVKVVPHSSIFEHPEDLPTLNSNAIQANIANIPGLSETFVMLDDDFFLTAPWTLADFVGPDGAQVLTGSTLASTIWAYDNLYLQMTMATSILFQQTFGPHNRYDPAHAPRLFQLKYLRELQAKLPAAFQQTSASHARSPTDLLVPSAYMWYVSQFQPGLHTTAPDTRTSFSTVDGSWVMGFANAVHQDYAARLASPGTKANLSDSQRMQMQQHLQDNFFGQMRRAMDAEAAGGFSGRQAAAYTRLLLHKLIKTWSTPGAKVVCLNDDTSDVHAFALPAVNQAVREFLASQYQKSSRFELRAKHDNGCNGRLPKTAFGRLPTRADFDAICHPRSLHVSTSAAQGTPAHHKTDAELPVPPAVAHQQQHATTTTPAAQQEPQGAGVLSAAVNPTAGAAMTVQTAASTHKSHGGLAAGTSTQAQAAQTQLTQAGVVQSGMLGRRAGRIDIE